MKLVAASQRKILAATDFTARQVCVSVYESLVHDCLVQTGNSTRGYADTRQLYLNDFTLWGYGKDESNTTLQKNPTRDCEKCSFCILSLQIFRKREQSFLRCNAAQHFLKYKSKVMLPFVHPREHTPM